MDVEKVIASALKPAAPANILRIYDGEELIGAASYRFQDGAVKLVNIGSKRKGTGKALFGMVKAASHGLEIWCQSDPESTGFYEKMGMTRCETLSDGRIIYRLAP